MFFALPLLNSEQDMVELLKIKNGMDEIDQSNRHEVQIPLHIRASHPALNFLHFFQKWIKPTLAEFVATFILIFWACMLQPPVRKITGTLILYSHLKPGSEPHISYQFLPAFSAGLALVIIITMFWDICVIQFNPGKGTIFS